MPIEFSIFPTAATADAGNAFYFDPSSYLPPLIEAEASEVDAVVIDDAGGLLDNLDIAASVGRATGRIGVHATHWAGVVEPATAARQLAYLDTLVGGRLGLRLTLAGADGSSSAHELACRRTDEYLTLLKRLWSNDQPFDHEGAFYSVRQGFVPAKGPQGWAIPIRMGGRSGTAIEVAARHADVFEIGFGTPQEGGAVVEKVRAAAGRCGRGQAIRFALALPQDRLGLLTAGSGSIAQAVARALRPYAEAGISEFMLTGPLAPGLQRLLATEVRRALDSPADLDSPPPFRLRPPVRPSRVGN